MALTARMRLRGSSFLLHFVPHDEQRCCKDQYRSQPEITCWGIAKNQPAGDSIERQLEIVEGLDVSGIGR
ncbi:hypothetical protein QO004_005708 [Rhizobium mesoamericanum]|nr:hypothetical protein [Rhizobium mesoamericanum]